MKLLLDEMLSVAIAELLAERDHDVVAVDAVPELRGVPDHELFDRAQTDDRAVVTYHREDFLALDRRYRSEGRTHAGLIILHPRRFPQRMAGVDRIVQSLDAFLHEGPPYRSFVHWLQ